MHLSCYLSVNPHIFPSIYIINLTINIFFHTAYLFFHIQGDVQGRTRKKTITKQTSFVYLSNCFSICLSACLHFLFPCFRSLSLSLSSLPPSVYVICLPIFLYSSSSFFSSIFLSFSFFFFLPLLCCIVHPFVFIPVLFCCLFFFLLFFLSCPAFFTLLRYLLLLLFFLVILLFPFVAFIPLPLPVHIIPCSLCFRLSYSYCVYRFSSISFNLLLTHFLCFIYFLCFLFSMSSFVPCHSLL